MSNRTTSSTLREELASPLIRPVMLCYLGLTQDIGGGNIIYSPIRASNTITINWNGYDWLGVGHLGTISKIEEGVDLQMYGVDVTLNGLNSEIYPMLNQDNNYIYQWKPGELYLGLLNKNLELMTTPVLVFKGIINNLSIEYGETISLTVSIESLLTDWQRPRISRFTHEDQISKYSDDKGLEFASSTTEMEIIWGRV